jgi:hypothetical protein
MHGPRTFSLALLLVWTAFSCQRNETNEARVEADRFPNSVTTLPPGDSGFQDGTFPPEADEDRRRFSGQARDAEPECPDQSQPGHDAWTIDSRCPQTDIERLVPLSSPTPSDTSTPMP